MSVTPFEGSKTFVSRFLKPRLLMAAVIFSVALTEEFSRSYLEKRSNRYLPASRFALQFGLHLLGDTPTVDLGLHALHCSA